MQTGGQMNILFRLIPKEKVAFIFDDQTIRQTLEKMQVYRYQSIPILSKQGDYIGTLSEGDLLWYIKDHHIGFDETENILITKVPRHRDNKAVDINTQMEDIFEVAMNQNFVPVIDDFGAFIGIITRKAIFSYVLAKKGK